MDRSRLKAQLELHEGRRVKPYVDTVGKITIGVGWNLSDNGLPDEIIDALLELGIKQAEGVLDSLNLGWRTLDEVRQRCLIDMAFNLGGRLKFFSGTLEAVRAKDFPLAAERMLESKWAVQVGGRALRLAEMMKTGTDFAV